MQAATVAAAGGGAGGQFQDVRQRMLEIEAENLEFSSEVRSLQQRLAQVRAQKRSLPPRLPCTPEGSADQGFSTPGGSTRSTSKAASLSGALYPDDFPAPAPLEGHLYSTPCETMPRGPAMAPAPASFEVNLYSMPCETMPRGVASSLPGPLGPDDFSGPRSLGGRQLYSTPGEMVASGGVAPSLPGALDGPEDCRGPASLERHLYSTPGEVMPKGGSSAASSLGEGSTAAPPSELDLGAAQAHAALARGAGGEVTLDPLCFQGARGPAAGPPGAGIAAPATPSHSVSQVDVEELRSENNFLTEQLVEASMESAQSLESFSNNRTTLWRLIQDLRQKLHLEQTAHAESRELLASAQEALDKAAAENSQLAERLLRRAPGEALPARGPDAEAAEALRAAQEEQMERLQRDAEQRARESEDLRRYVWQAAEQANSTILDLARRNLELERGFEEACGTLQQHGLPAPVAPSAGSRTSAASAGGERHAGAPLDASLPGTPSGARRLAASADDSSCRPGPAVGDGGAALRAAPSAGPDEQDENRPHNNGALPNWREDDPPLRAARLVRPSAARASKDATSSHAFPVDRGDHAAASSPSLGGPFHHTGWALAGAASPCTGLPIPVDGAQARSLVGRIAAASGESSQVLHGSPKLGRLSLGSLGGSDVAGLSDSSLCGRSRSTGRQRARQLERSLDLKAAELRRLQQQAISAAQ